MTSGCILVGYAAIALAVDYAVHRLYIYFPIWVAVYYIAFHLIYGEINRDKVQFERGLDNVLNEDWQQYPMWYINCINKNIIK